MKQFLFSLVLLPLLGVAQNHVVNVNYDFAGGAVCPPGTTGAVLPCFRNFAVVPASATQATAATVPPLATVPIAVPSGSGAVTGIPIAFTLPQFGAVGIVMIGVAADGTVLASDPAKCMASFPPNPPTSPVIVK